MGIKQQKHLLEAKFRAWIGIFLNIRHCSSGLRAKQSKKISTGQIFLVSILEKLLFHWHMIEQFLMEQKVHIERVYDVINYWKAKNYFSFTAVYQIKFSKKREGPEIIYDIVLVIQRHLLILKVGINGT